mmetsp:Transcript_2801/g.6477  ORF Transcript_2801/g.6477 Transcript_2801/m.6477 type:complete len:179 (-) Transcript_2801:162-698(-)|eukprot:CAMPEP_0178999436 /NCGR_PEP_ID=MMETSP0795-20121207/10063_1 /TAXON_ID=88552 /ORGANISM="Amoebophrya sp., Strain Ameob2" /LENGTH=178 /DNA_ID=CAMNT_0020692217 /DNA_START=75 /DNA_END=611 /DNA_ORIENTATION=+
MATSHALAVPNPVAAQEAAAAIKRVPLPDTDEVKDLLSLTVDELQQRILLLKQNPAAERVEELERRIRDAKKNVAEKRREGRTAEMRLQGFREKLAAKEGQLKAVEERQAREMAFSKRNFKNESEGLNREIAATRVEITRKKRERKELIAAAKDAGDTAAAAQQDMQEEEDLWGEDAG